VHGYVPCPDLNEQMVHLYKWRGRRKRVSPSRDSYRSLLEVLQHQLALSRAGLDVGI